MAYMNIGITLVRMGELDAALEHLDKALKIQCKALGEESIEVADVRCRTATVYAQQGSDARARVLFGAAAKTYARVLGPGHEKTQAALRWSR
jgi:Tfp pilus assembly protein PilF